MKRSLAPIAVALLVIVLLVGFALLRYRESQFQSRLDSAFRQLEEILTAGETLGARPAPGNQIQELMANDYGRSLLTELSAAQERLAFDQSTGGYVCIWNGPGGRQTLFAGPRTGLTAGMPSQVTIKRVRFEMDEAVFLVGASSAVEDEDEVEQIFELDPGMQYEVRIKTDEIDRTDFISIHNGPIDAGMLECWDAGIEQLTTQWVGLKNEKWLGSRSCFTGQCNPSSVISCSGCASWHDVARMPRLPQLSSGLPA